MKLILPSPRICPRCKLTLSLWWEWSGIHKCVSFRCDTCRIHDIPLINNFAMAYKLYGYLVGTMDAEEYL